MPRSGIGLNELLGMRCPDEQLHDLPLEQEKGNCCCKRQPRFNKESNGEYEEEQAKYNGCNALLSSYAEVALAPRANGVDPLNLLFPIALLRIWNFRSSILERNFIAAMRTMDERLEHA